MATSTKGDLEKALAARNTKVKIDSLNFEIKQRDQKIAKMKVELDNLRIENEKLKGLIENYKAVKKPAKT